MSLCDRVCQLCPVLGLCGGIDGPNYKCPFLGCPLKDSDAVGKMRYCYVCHLHDLVYDMAPQLLQEAINDLSVVSRRTVSRMELPKFVPLITLTNDQSYVLNKARCEAIILGYYEILLANRIDEVIGKGIHDVLGYDGKVLLSSIMPDEFLVKSSTFDEFYQLAAEGGFDAVVGWDTPVYDDIPLYDSWVNLLRGLQLTEKLLRLDLPVIGLAKGNNGRQIEYSIDTLSKMGVENFALHASEYLINWRYNARARNILYFYATRLQERAETILIMGAGSPSTLEFVRDVFWEEQKIRLVGLSWYLDAKRHAIYWNDSSIVDCRTGFVECSCPVCASNTPLRFAEHASIRAAHNYEAVRQLAGDGSMPQMNALDLTLPEGMTIIVGDLHIGSNLSQYNDFLGLILNEKPQAIIFLGATFDLNENIQINDIRNFFSALHEVNCITASVTGCCDTDPEKLLQRMGRLAFGDTHQAFALKKSEDKDDLYIGDFFRFHRSMSKKLILRLRNGDSIILKHGHKLFPDPAISMGEISQQMVWEKKRENADLLIIGHIHRAFFDKEAGIASPGTWELPTPVYKPVVNKHDLLRSIIIEEDGSLHLA